MSTKFFSNKNKKGYSLVEMLIYMSILSLFCVIIVKTLLTYSGSYRTLTVLRTLDHSANNSLERISRDVRASASVDSVQSTLGSSPGVLTLTSTGKSTRFYIFNNTLQVDVNNASSGPLTLSGARVTSLTFTHLDNTVTDAVKIDMTIQATSGTVTRTKSYHSTVILRGK